jgi:hypothetical protein
MTTSDTVVLHTDSYARIRNPRVQSIVHLIGAAVFLVLLVAVVLALPSNFEYWIKFISDAPAATRDALAEFGFTIQAFAIYRFVLELILAFSYYVAGAIIFGGGPMTGLPTC